MRPAIQVILMSGYSGLVSKDRAQIDKADGYLAKPFAPEALARKVREVLDRAPKTE